MIEKIACGTPIVAVCGRAAPTVIDVGGATVLVCDRPDDVAGAIDRTRIVDPEIVNRGRCGSGYEQTDQEVPRKGTRQSHDKEPK